MKMISIRHCNGSNINNNEVNNAKNKKNWIKTGNKINTWIMNRYGVPMFANKRLAPGELGKK